MRANLVSTAPWRNRRRAIAAGSLTSALVLATVALAQPRGARTPPRAGPASAPASASSASAAAAATAPFEAGPVPAPPSNVADDAGRLSPLNPAANEFSDAGPPSPSVDYDRLLADVASLRARAAAVSDILFHSRLAISLQTSGDHGRVAGAAVAIDDGTVWTAPTPFRAEEATLVYDHAVAPGRHAVTVDVERRDDRDDTFRSAQRSRFSVDVPADARLSLDIRLWDDSSMGADFPTDKKGQYDLRVRAEAKAKPLSREK